MTSNTTNNWPRRAGSGDQRDDQQLANDRTQITYPDAMVISYDFDTGAELITVREKGHAATGLFLLGSYTYDDLGRRTGVTRGSGTTTVYGYDGVSRLASLTHTLVGGNVESQAYGLGYTASSQINALSQSNGVYVWAASNGPSSFDGEFNSLSLWNGSTGVWATNFGFGGVANSVAARTLPGTGEVELYVDPAMTGTGKTALGLNPYSETGGVLTLHAGPTPTADVSSIWGYNFTSGMISSRSTFTQTYGYFEAEMKLPPGQGNWPAFWLYAANAGSELDVMEEQNGSNLITGTAHNNGAGGASTGVTNTVPNLTAGFHKFGVLWTPTTITWYVDRVSIGSVATPSNLNSPMYMIANLALNGGTPSTYAGGDLQIGYIRAYTLANSPVSNQNLTYTVNGQNQLTSSGGAAISYDARGNLNADSVNTYSYDLLNRLVTTGAGVTTVYDPEDRLLSLTQGATTTQFAYVGPDVATEFNASNQILRRYVPGPAEDEPVVWFEGSDGANPRWLLQDHQGSVVAVADMTGGALAINTYSDYGAPGSGNLGRYQFTGQFYLPEVGVYDYKARLYSPILARFMQTDPVGYKDGLNWYDYVHGDPVNGSDASGECTGSIFSGADGTCLNGGDTTDIHGDMQGMLRQQTLLIAIAAPPIGEGAAEGEGAASGEGASAKSEGLAADGAASAEAILEQGVKALGSAWEKLTGSGPSTGRSQPQNLKEQIALRQAQSHPAAGQTVPVRGGMNDGRFHQSDGWVKKRQNINEVEIHYNFNMNTGKSADWKFK